MAQSETWCWNQQEATESGLCLRSVYWFIDQSFCLSPVRSMWRLVTDSVPPADITIIYILTLTHKHEPGGRDLGFDIIYGIDLAAVPVTSVWSCAWSLLTETSCSVTANKQPTHRVKVLPPLTSSRWRSRPTETRSHDPTSQWRLMFTCTGVCQQRLATVSCNRQTVSPLCAHKALLKQIFSSCHLQQKSTTPHVSDRPSVPLFKVTINTTHLYLYITKTQVSSAVYLIKPVNKRHHLSLPLASSDSAPPVRKHKETHDLWHFNQVFLYFQNKGFLALLQKRKVFRVKVFLIPTTLSCSVWGVWHQAGRWLAMS